MGNPMVRALLLFGFPAVHDGPGIGARGLRAGAALAFLCGVVAGLHTARALGLF
jgi:hypothetical protein